MLRLCFDAHRADGIVWAVELDGVWHTTHSVVVDVPMTTRYTPDAQGDEPKACLVTYEIVNLQRRSDGSILIESV